MKNRKVIPFNLEEEIKYLEKKDKITKYRKRYIKPKNRRVFYFDEISLPFGNHLFCQSWEF